MLLHLEFSLELVTTVERHALEIVTKHIWRAKRGVTLEYEKEHKTALVTSQLRKCIPAVVDIQSMGSAGRMNSAG